MKYLIRDLRQVVGNCAMFWRPDRQGYTCNVEEAGHYTETEARAIERMDPNRCVILDIDEVEKISEVHADVQKLPARVQFTARDASPASARTPRTIQRRRRKKSGNKVPNPLKTI